MELRTLFELTRIIGRIDEYLCIFFLQRINLFMLHMTFVSGIEWTFHLLNLCMFIVSIVMACLTVAHIAKLQKDVDCKSVMFLTIGFVLTMCSGILDECMITNVKTWFPTKQHFAQLMAATVNMMLGDSDEWQQHVAHVIFVATIYATTEVLMVVSIVMLRVLFPTKKMPEGTERLSRIDV